MTTLRDDGYLQTDDPVVAACFLEKRVVENRKKREGLLCRIDVTQKGIVFGVGFWETDRIYKFEYDTKAILIAAKTVAEVWKDADPVKLSALAAATGGRCDNPFPMFDWLTTYTKEDTNGQ